MADEDDKPDGETVPGAVDSSVQPGLPVESSREDDTPKLANVVSKLETIVESLGNHVTAMTTANAPGADEGQEREEGPTKPPWIARKL